MSEAFSRLPSVDRLLAHPQAQTLITSFGHALTVDALREALDDARQVIRTIGDAPEADALVESEEEAEKARKERHRRSVDREGTASSPVAEKLKPMPASSRKTGRNEPCPCGSGKKYKKCCGK